MDFRNTPSGPQGFIQSAQALALREGHQRFSPEHLLKVLLDDEEGLAAGLIRAAGGDSRSALRETEAALAKRMPKVSGGGRTGLSGARDGARLRDREQACREGGRFLRHRRAAAAGARDREVRRGKSPEGGGRHAARRSTRRSTIIAQGPHRRFALPPSRPMTRSRNIRATSPRRRAPASSIRSSAATTKSAAPSRCCRGAPRTIRC